VIDSCISLECVLRFSQNGGSLKQGEFEYKVDMKFGNLEFNVVNHKYFPESSQCLQCLTVRSINFG